MIYVPLEMVDIDALKDSKIGTVVDWDKFRIEVHRVFNRRADGHYRAAYVTFMRSTGSRWEVRLDRADNLTVHIYHHIVIRVPQLYVFKKENMKAVMGYTTKMVEEYDSWMKGIPFDKYERKYIDGQVYIIKREKIDNRIHVQEYLLQPVWKEVVLDTIEEILLYHVGRGVFQLLKKMYRKAEREKMNSKQAYGIYVVERYRAMQAEKFLDVLDH